MKDKMLLLVEDNPDDVALTLRALKKNNMELQLEVVHDGEQALDFLFGKGEYSGRNLAKQPDVIFLDLKLPKIDGLELLRRLRGDALTRYLPVVVLSSSVEERDILQCCDLGANSYIRKPVDFIEFTETVRQLGQYWLRLNHAPAP